MEWHEKQAVPYNTWKTNVTEMKRLTRVVEKVVKRWHMLIVAVPEHATVTNAPGVQCAPRVHHRAGLPLRLPA